MASSISAPLSTTPSANTGGYLSIEELQTLRHILTRLNTSSSNISSSATDLLSDSSSLSFIFHFYFAQSNFSRISFYTSDNNSALTVLDTSQH